MRHGLRALVVDDDDFSRHTAVRILKRLGATDVAEAASGAEALRLVERAADGIDLIMCDLRMPELDGIETLEGLAVRCRSTMFVLASGAEARLLRAVASTALRCGISALHVVSKPVTMAKMEEIVAALTDRTLNQEAPAQATACTPMVSVDDIRQGIDAGEFVTFYQPKVDIGSRRVRGAEALIRWRSPRLGLLAPAAFLGVAQANGLLGDLLYAGLACAGSHCAAWRMLGHDFGVSVNLPVSTLSSRDLPRLLEEFVSNCGLVPNEVTFEVTEDGWLQQQDLAREVLTRLRVRGFGLSIDDFGTGYSGVQQLLDAPFNEMKIDRAFVHSAPTDPEASIALASSVALAQQLDMTVVAEGVETEAQWNMVADMGCDQVQGFLIARPMPAEQFGGWLAEWSVTQSIPLAY